MSRWRCLRRMGDDEGEIMWEVEVDLGEFHWGLKSQTRCLEISTE